MSRPKNDLYWRGSTLYCRIPCIDTKTNEITSRWSTGIEGQGSKAKAIQAGKLMVGTLNQRFAMGLPMLRPWRGPDGTLLFEKKKVSEEHDPLLRVAAERYMQARGNSKTKSVAWYVGNVVGMWGDLKCSEVNFHRVSTFASTCLSDEYSNSYIRSNIAYAKLMLKRANLFEDHNSEYWLERNPLAGVTFKDLGVGAGNIRRNPLTQDEFEEAYAYMVKRGDIAVANHFLCGWEGGHRLEENAGLRYGMISESTPTGWQGGTKRVFVVPGDLTKKKHNTTTRLTNRLYEAIKYRIHKPEDLCFPNPAGEEWKDYQWETYWDEHVRVDLPHLKDHVYRDTRAGFATHMTNVERLDEHVTMRLMGLEKFDNFQRYFLPNEDNDFKAAYEVEERSTLRAQAG